MASPRCLYGPRGPGARLLRGKSRANDARAHPLGRLTPPSGVHVKVFVKLFRPGPPATPEGARRSASTARLIHEPAAIGRQCMLRQQARSVENCLSVALECISKSLGHVIR